MKTRKSKLDAYAEQLSGWAAQNLTLAEMQSKLAALGCAASPQRLSCFLERQRQAELQARVLGNIATGSRQAAEIEAAFQRNPEPKFATLVSFYKRLILTLQIEGSVNPELLTAANEGFKALLDAMKVEQKREEIALAERRVKLLEQKAAAFDQVKQAVASGGLTPETLTKIERELKLL